MSQHYRGGIIRLHEQENALTYRADFWYRAGDDPDQSIRTLCQMSTNQDEITALAYAQTLAQEQGYTIQRLVIHTLCPTCEGTGRTWTLPKGRHHTKSRRIPLWMMSSHECVPCRASGVVASKEV